MFDMRAMCLVLATRYELAYKDITQPHMCRCQTSFKQVSRCNRVDHPSNPNALLPKLW
jgi:hypothetical protein